MAAESSRPGLTCSFLHVAPGIWTLQSNSCGHEFMLCCTAALAMVSLSNQAAACGVVGGDADLAAGAVGMAAAMEEDQEAEQAARQGQQVLSSSSL